MSELPSNQEEYTHISASLEVEQIEEGLYRSVKLWKPPRARGVFGGQVISQACVSASNSVDVAFALHSLHCYFLASANPQIAILYNVDRLRTGRSFITCSRPEPWQPSHAWPMPQVPLPDECEPDEVKYARIAAMTDNPKLKAIFISKSQERRRGPIEIRSAQIPRPGEAEPYSYWMRAKSLDKSYDPSYQKCILSYISDLNFIWVASRVLGLTRYSKGPNALGMTSTIDHSISFYDNDFDCGEWLLYVISCPRTGSGRGIMHGRMYTDSGRLIAVMSQEGVVRADRRPSDVQAKL